ncbi:M90 family metallopeptidase [Flavobacterium ardleyense]|uniref:M90 family metallopeptidase n=1 Tax=Flavobacterium ardleyense TaxID=2038737 RepID=UPI00298BD12B|nr:zinc-dependent peptidase [Flavobacterium ardleyense]
MTYVIIIFSILIILVIFSLFKSSQKRKLAEFPEHWHPILLENVQFYENLSPTEQKRFQSRMMVFLSEVYIDTVKVKLTELDKILVAASAVIPVFGFKEWHYHNLSGVLLYPDTFNDDLQFDTKHKKRTILGLVGTGRFENQMILSRKALHDGFNITSDKHNTAVHEFVHLIDKMDGVTDGVPERLIQKPYIDQWLKLIHRKMEEINNNKSDIRHYGGTSQAEFLAVASEYFFEQPEKLEKKHPELYKMLSECFQTGN